MSHPLGIVERMCDVLVRVEAGGLDCWPEPALRSALAEIEGLRARVDADQAQVLAELVRRGRVPEAMFGSSVSPREAQRRTKTAVALSDGSLPGAADALAAGEASFEHVAALAAIKDRLPDGAAQNLLALAAQLPPDKFARALQRVARPVDEVADASTGTTDRGGRWFRFGYNGYEGTVVLNGLEAVMDRQWRAAHPDRAEEKLDRPPWGQRLAGALLEMSRNALAGQPAVTNPTETSPTANATPAAATPDTETGPTANATPAAATPDGETGPTAAATPRPPSKAPPRAQPEIIVVITYDKLFADAKAAGICTTIDGVPLPVETVRKLLVDAKIYPIVLDGDGEILDFGRSRRFFTNTQKLAAAVRDLTCQFADCDRPVRYADYHHCHPWAHGGPTDVANAAPTCDACHDKLTNHGYRIERHHGTTYTYSPDGQLIHQRNNRWQR